MKMDNHSWAFLLSAVGIAASLAGFGLVTLACLFVIVLLVSSA